MINLETTITDLAMEMVDSFNKNGAKPQKKEMKKLDSTICAVVDILVQNGIAAMFLWLIEKKEDQREAICKGLLATLNHKDLELKIDNRNYDKPQEKVFYEQLGKMTANIDQTLFCRMILERVLIYARHWTKYYAA